MSPSFEKDFSRDQERSTETCNQSKTSIVLRLDFINFLVVLQGLKQAQHEINLLEKMISELEEASGTMTATLLTMPPPPSPSISKKERKSKKSSKKASKSSNGSVSSYHSATIGPCTTGSIPNFLGTEQFKVRNSSVNMERK